MANCAAAAVLAAALLAGCGGGGSGDVVFSAAPVAEAAALRPSRGPSVAELSAALAEQKGDENLICSPFSVWLPLAALAGATNGAGRDALLNSLGAAGISVEDVNSAASRMLYGLLEPRGAAEDSSAPLQIANAIFVDSDVTLKQDFAQMFGEHYRGAAINVDFESPDAVRAVNSWASENTGGLIREVVSEFDPRTVAAIANAIYFSDRWGWEFDPNRTKEDIFHSTTGDETANFMVREGGGQAYYEDENVQAMPLGFISGGGLYIILPKDGDATGLLSSMTAEYFGEIWAKTENATGKLLLPRFAIDSGVMSLGGVLTALGVPLFDEKSAPLTGGIIEEDVPVWLSSAGQKAYITVDEKGTTAAAVTVMMALASEMPGEIEPEVPFYMNCDKPFVFVLYSATDGVAVPLFTGMVNHTR
jgi:serine protease inhibitor